MDYWLFIVLIILLIYRDLLRPDFHIIVDNRWRSLTKFCNDFKRLYGNDASNYQRSTAIINDPAAHDRWNRTELYSNDHERSTLSKLSSAKAILGDPLCVVFPRRFFRAHSDPSQELLFDWWRRTAYNLMVVGSTPAPIVVSTLRQGDYTNCASLHPGV